ncbi:unnamed protein product [Rotaria sp. Silwood2]|nr:unnamed protein product [Rotaria sp. Silwood2]CAF2570111.1 unnamed protein product [Rotaria sp. Silwood2]CAF2963949.1 unnamed protein product [Rotaria sp. Silwood2]
MNSAHIVDSPTLLTECLLTCNGSNMCIPWPILEPIKISDEKDNNFGLMYGIKDENIRRNLGYSIGEHKSLNRKKRAFRKIFKQQYKQNNLLDEEVEFDSIRQGKASSTDNRMSIVQQISITSPKENLKITEQKSSLFANLFKQTTLSSLPFNTDSNDKSERISINSKISQDKNATTSRLSSSRTISKQPSIVNSKRSSTLSNGNSNIDQPSRLRSIHGKCVLSLIDLHIILIDKSAVIDQLIVLDGSRRMTTRKSSSHIEELPVTSMADHYVPKHTPSRVTLQKQQQLNNYIENSDKSALLSPQSSETYGYRTLSNRRPHKNSQSLSSVLKKSINTKQSRGSIQSRKNPSANDVRDNKSTLSVRQSNDKQRLRTYTSQTPISYQTHVDSDDSSVALTSSGKIKHSPSIFNTSWEQRLMSPLLMTSVSRSNSIHLTQKITSSTSNKQLSIDKTPNNFNFDNYSKYQTSPSRSFLNQINGKLLK